MRLALYIFIGLLGICFNGAIAFDGKEVPDVPPPTLVKCASQDTCDYNQERLESFVTGFYRWYMTSSEIIFSKSWHKLPRDEFKRRRDEHDKLENRIIKDNITPEFYAWFSTAFDKDGSRSADFRYCSPDVNFFTCSQDIGDDWIAHTSAQLIEANREYALLIVRFSSQLTNKNGQPYLPHLIAVQLKPVNGFWRIAGTANLITIY